MNNVPNLRFKEFSDEWEEKCLSSFLSESKIKGDTGDIAHKLTVKLWAKGIVEKREDLQGSSETQYYIRKAGQLMYGKLDFLNCAFGIVPEELDGFQSTLDAPAFDVYNANSSFLLNRIIQKNFYKKNGDIADGSRKAKRVHVDTFLGMKIFIPTLKEQEKIASFFSLIDKEIELQTEKVEELKNYKKGIMQKIFSQELRIKGFSEDWKIKKLGDITIKTGVKNKKNEDYEVYSISNKYGFIPQDEQFENSRLSELDKTLYQIVKKEEFAYNPARINVGSIGVLEEDKTVIVSSLYVCFRLSEGMDYRFFKAYFESYKFNKDVIRNTEGSVRQYLFYENFCHIKVNVPNLEEQEKIASLFSLIDKKIDVEIDKLEQLRLQKKGFLQQMFI